jgi:outer membrane protein assembly factor BamB
MSIRPAWRVVLPVTFAAFGLVLALQPAEDGDLAACPPRRAQARSAPPADAPADPKPDPKPDAKADPKPADSPRRGADWPCFGGGPTRNMVNLAETNIPETWEVRPGKPRKNVRWVAQLGSRAYGGPVISGGKVFVGTNNEHPRNTRDFHPTRVHPVTKKPVPLDKGVLMCLRESDGEFLWQHVSDKLDTDRVNDWPREGVASTPWVDGDRLYYVNNRCELVCLDVNGLADGNQGVTDEQYTDPTDADVIWKLDMMRMLGVFPHGVAACSPLKLGPMLYIVTGNGVSADQGNVPAPRAPSFLAVHAPTGYPVWWDSSPGKEILRGQWSNAVLLVSGMTPQVVFPGGDGWLRAFDPGTGKLLWKCDGNPKVAKGRYGRGAKNDFLATPVAYNGRLYVGTGQDPDHADGPADFWCLEPDRRSGDISLELNAAGLLSAPFAMNPTTGVAWRAGRANGNGGGFSRTISTCAIHDWLVYVADLSGCVRCFDARSGRLYWEHDLKSAVWGAPYWVDGKVYVATDDGDVWIFRHGREKRLVGKVEMEVPIRSTPVAAHGVLYIMTETHLYALEQQ